MRVRMVLRVAIVLVLIVATCAALGGCRLYYLLFTGISLGELGFTGEPAADIVVEFTLYNTGSSSLISYNQTHLSVGEREIAYGIRIDVDDDPLTEDPAIGGGYDIDISVQYLRRDTGVVGYDEIDFILDPDGGELFVSEPVDTAYVWMCNNRRRLVTFAIQANDPVFAALSPTCRTQFYTYYHPSTGPVEDVVADIIGNGSATDAAGDHATWCLDITNASIEYRIGGVQ